MSIWYSIIYVFLGICKYNVETRGLEITDSAKSRLFFVVVVVVVVLLLFFMWIYTHA